MPEITPIAGLGVDDQKLKVFSDNLEFIISKGMKPRYMAIMMGIDEGNWNKYMSGVFPATHDIIDDLAIIFIKILKKKPLLFPEERAIDTNILEDEKAPYTEIEQKLAELTNEFKLMNIHQKSIAEKLDKLLEEGANRKPAEESS